ncbi:MAG: hypothetical protein IJS82_05790 [Paludibacteraceae bacterium]|nr:hypothetical protein [Paludibacteraceae bacterium]
MTKKQERNIVAWCGTLLFMGVVGVLLWLVQMKAYQPDEPDYVEVLMEEPETPEPEIPRVKPEPVSSRRDPGAASPAQSQPANQPTQNSAEQVVSEEDRLLAIQQAKADSIAEANRQAKKKAEDLIGGFTFTNTPDNGTAANKTENNGRGTTLKGEGTDGDSKWSLAGRGLVGKLPMPANTFNQDGRVLVEIRVNPAGQVVSATHKGGTISDKATIQLALDAARKAKFTQGDHDQIGTITYNFKFN